ncbi:MAG TPA: transketolase [Fibrobacteres bacterium]|jgi:transketolase|nr:transketolase [Fibrobacterota bacterium]
MSCSVSEKTADMVRILSASMVEKAASGHPGGAMGGADFITILYTEFLRYDPMDMNWANRDRFFLDPGHMAPMLYSILTLMGNYSVDDIKNFRQWGSITPGHPEHDVSRGVENTSGPLGLGHCMAAGAAITERFLAARFGEWMTHKIYAYISDGGIQEEISQGVGRIAGNLGLSNFIMFYDSNDVQLSSMTSDVTCEDTAKKYQAWGWNVMIIDGNDHAGIRDALTKANSEKERPTLIIGKTIMGKGARTKAGECFERKVETHGMPLSKAGACFEKTIAYLGGNAGDPFEIFPEVKQYCARVIEEKKKEAIERKNIEDKWKQANPGLAAKFNAFISGKVPEIDYKSIEQKPGIATRSASGKVLSVFCKQIENMIVASADLSNSDNTDAFLKNTTIFKKNDFKGQFLQAGVAELTMAGLMNGMALHGGVIPACGTFFVFSDYMKPAVRLAALMKLPVKYVWTHDSFRVGEDGPTHEPIEHEAQIRLLEKMNNLEGKRSLLVLRPADAAETTAAWKLAMENTESPSALLLSRQSIVDIPAKAGSTRFEDALQARNGAYIAQECDGKPDCIFVANGSEVSTLIAAAVKLREKGMKIRIVSAPSEGLFVEQPAQYKESVITPGIPVFGLTAGLPVNLVGFAGPFGKVIGMGRFGASAPFKVLDEKFGYTPDAVINQVEKYLAEYKSNVKKYTL